MIPEIDGRVIVLPNTKNRALVEKIRVFERVANEPEIDTIFVKIFGK